MIWMMSLALAGGSKLPACAESPDAEASAELEKLHKAAQVPGGESTVKIRVKSVMKLYKKGLVCTGEDHYRAGAILMQSRDTKTLAAAHEIANVAAHAHIDRGTWLSMNTFDRWQISQGNPQRYGTQTGREGQCLYPVDEAFPDDNRVAWGAKPLTEIYAAFLKMREIDGTPNATTFNSLSLFCRLESW